MRGPFRSAIGWGFILLAVFLAAPVSKPSLWILDDWGDIRWPVWFWPLIFIGAGVALLRTKRPQAVRAALFLAFMLLGTIATAAYLSQGWNGFSVMMLPFACFCVQLNLDIKAETRRDL